MNNYQQTKLTGLIETLMVLKEYALTDSFLQVTDLEQENAFDEISKEIFTILKDIKSLITEATDYERENLSLFKKELIDKIKSIPKKNRRSSKVEFLKRLVNNLEELEVINAYNIKQKEKTSSHRIIEYLLLEHESSYHFAGFFIRTYPHLINAYNKENYNLLNRIIEKFFAEFKVDGNKTLLYSYFNTIRILLSTNKLKFKKEEIEYAKNLINRNFKSIKNKDLDKDLIKIVKDLKNLLDHYQIKKDYTWLQETFGIDANEYLSKIEIPNFHKQLESSDDFIITIDSDRTVLKDDGFSVHKRADGCYEIKVYVTDPNALLEIDSDLMNHARNRGKNLNRDQHMFPKKFCKSALSLEENIARKVRCYKLVLNANKEVIDFTITKKVIAVSRNLAFSQVDQIINTSTEEKNLNNTLELLLTLKEDLVKNYRPDLKLKDKKIGSQKLVEILMNVTNFQVASYFFKNKLPFVYCKNNTLLPLEALKDADKQFQPLLQELPREPIYAITPGDELRSSVTSPMRRYVDVLANVCEDKFYFENVINEEQKNKFNEWLRQELAYQMRRSRELSDYFALKEEIKDYQNTRRMS